MALDAPPDELAAAPSLTDAPTDPPAADSPAAARGRRSLLSLRRRWVGALLALALLVGGATAVWWFVLRDEPAETVGMTTEAQVVEVTSGTIGETVSAEGTVAAAATEDLSFAASGTVTSVWVSAGDTVTAGQVLATIDSAELESALAAAEADLADAEAQLDDAEDAGSSDEQIEVLEASVVTAQDAVDSAAEALEGATLTASIDGLVTSVDLTTGEELGSSGTSGTTVTGSGSGSGQTSSALGSSDATGALPGASGVAGAASGDTSATTASDPQIQIVSAGSFAVELSVDTSDIDQIEVGQEVDLSISTESSGTTATGPGGFMPPGMAGGFPGGDASSGSDDAEDDDSVDAAELTATGLVSEISGVADASSGVATYTVTVGFSDDSGDIWAGSTATAEIDVAARDDVTLVSSTAVTTSDGVSTVTVALDGTVDGATEEREVTTGETSGNQIEIVEGLEPGDQVIAEMPSFGGGGGFPGGVELPEGFEPPTGGGFPGAAPSAEGGS